MRQARAAVVGAKKEIGISLKQALRELGYTDEQIATMDEEREDEPQDGADGKAGNALMKALSRGPSGGGKAAKPAPAAEPDASKDEGAGDA